MTYSFEFFYRPSELHRVTVSLSRLRTLDRPGTEKIAVESEAEPHHLVPRNSTGLDPYTGTDTFNVDEELTKNKYPFEARYLVVGLVSQGLILPIEGRFGMKYFLSSLSLTVMQCRTSFTNSGQCPQSRESRSCAHSSALSAARSLDRSRTTRSASC